MNPFRTSQKTQAIRPQNPYCSNLAYGVCLQNTYDYSPFGVSLDGRTVEGDFYRYGFQKQEKDDEVSGINNFVNYTFRIQDTRVSRFLSCDPKSSKFSEYSCYSFSGNNVISSIELEGAEDIPSFEGYNPFDVLFSAQCGIKFDFNGHLKVFSDVSINLSNQATNMVFNAGFDFIPWAKKTECNLNFSTVLQLGMLAPQRTLPTNVSYTTDAGRNVAVNDLDNSLDIGLGYDMRYREGNLLKREASLILSVKTDEIGFRSTIIAKTQGFSELIGGRMNSIYLGASYTNRSKFKTYDAMSDDLFSIAHIGDRSLNLGYTVDFNTQRKNLNFNTSLGAIQSFKSPNEVMSFGMFTTGPTNNLFTDFSYGKSMNMGINVDYNFSKKKISFNTYLKIGQNHVAQ